MDYKRDAHRKNAAFIQFSELAAGILKTVAIIAALGKMDRFSSLQAFHSVLWNDLSPRSSGDPPVGGPRRCRKQKNRILLMRFTIALLIVAGGILSAAAKDRHFAEGLSLEAEVTEEDGKLRLTIIRYDEDHESHWLLSGDLIEEGGGKYRLIDETTDEDNKTRTLTGTVKISDGALSYSGLKDSGGKLEIPAAGGPWKEIDDATLLRNARTRYEAADKLLNDAWTLAKTGVGDKNLPPLRDDQRRWLKYRDAMSEKTVRDIHSHTGKAPDYKTLPDYWQAMTEYTVSRTPVLRAWSGKNVSPGRSGIYRDSYGGEVTRRKRRTASILKSTSCALRLSILAKSPASPNSAATPPHGPTPQSRKAKKPRS
jgi:uncharacterized protein YecT (DUF1311 family)